MSACVRVEVHCDSAVLCMSESDVFGLVSISYGVLDSTV